MPKEITVQLTSPIVDHHGAHTSITLREPKAREAFEIGELGVYSKTEGGDLIYLSRDHAYAQYLRACVVKPADGNLVEAQLSLADSFRVREAIDGFFADARRQAFPDSPPPSSGSDGPTSGAPAS